MKGLLLTPNFHRGDGPAWRDAEAADRFYDMLIDAHRSLDEAASHAFNARLILLLANHIGDLTVLRQAVDLAGDCSAEAAGGEAADNR